MGVPVCLAFSVVALVVISASAQGLVNGCEQYGEDAQQSITAAMLGKDLDCMSALINKFKDNKEAVANAFVVEDPKERAKLLKKSDDRNNDVDVVIVKAFSKAALDGGDAEKLSRIMVFSTLKESDPALEAEIRAKLSNRDASTEVLDSDANTAFQPETQGRRLRTLLDLYHRRHLMCDSCSPSDSLICANCWASDVCKSFFWCKDGDD